MSKLFVDVSDLPHDAYGFIQLMFLGFVYGQVLMKGSNLIKDGSELLLLIPSLAGIVGSIVLPVLGAVPDGAIVIFSGLGPDAQTQVAVGVGALAGSTVMLLTVPWVLCLLGGRVNLLENGEPNYSKPKGAVDFKKLVPEGRFWGTGCKVGTSIGYSAKVMLVTLVSFLIVQIPALAKNCGELHAAPVNATGSDSGSSAECHSPPIAALIGGIVATLFFVFYLWDQARLANSNPVKEALIDELRKKALDDGLMNIRGLFPEKIMDLDGVIPISRDNKRFQAFLRPFFNRFDTNGNGTIEAEELRGLLVALGENPTKERVKEVMAEVDTDKSGSISLPEFAAIVAAALDSPHPMSPTTERQQSGLGRGEAEPLLASSGKKTQKVNEADEPAEGDEDEEEEEEEAEMPEEFVTLTPAEQQRKVLQRSCWQMGLGVFLVLFFSDPMVDVFSEVGVRLGIKPFFVAFVLAPLASNASELIAAYAYSLKKTEKTMTISLSSLIGAACMNNTFCLALFLFLVYFKHLKWVFTAETVCIVVVEIIMFFIAQMRLQKSWMALVVGALFPLGILIVAALEAAGLD